ncbi:MAG: hypothetical protein K6G80_04295 [Treponema sp.]|nr:hypothetical protein [Treponema sp.]
MDFSQIPDGHEDGGEQMVFRYNREERLKHAPQNVRDYYNGTFMPRRGLFRSLISTHGNRYLLISVGLCIGVVLLASVLLHRESATVGGVGTQLSAFSFEESVYASLKLDKAGKHVSLTLPAPVSARFSFIGVDGQPVQEQLITGKYDGKELFLRTTTTDYDIVKVTVVLDVAGQSVDLTAAVLRR